MLTDSAEVSTLLATWTMSGGGGAELNAEACRHGGPCSADGLRNGGQKRSDGREGGEAGLEELDADWERRRGDREDGGDEAREDGKVADGSAGLMWPSTGSPKSTMT